MTEGFLFQLGQRSTDHVLDSVRGTDLVKNNDGDLVQGRGFKRRKDILFRRIDRMEFALLCEELLKFYEIRFLTLVFE